MPPVVRTENLTKFYGKHRGIVGLNLEVQQGEVFGFLGPNGAGKTTTIRLLLDFIHPTEGQAHLFGLDAHADSLAIRRRTGYVPGDLAMYDSMTGRDLLTYFGNLRGSADWDYVDGLVSRLDLDLSRRIRTLSKGNRQKVGLVQSLMHQPELLVLDEPTSGLDPLVQHEFYRIIREFKAQGKTVFLSSHFLAEVEKIADRVGIVREGRLVVAEQVDVLKSKAVRELELHFAQPVPVERFSRVPGVRDLQADNNDIRCKVEGSVDALIKLAAQFELTNITSHEPDLEEIFLAYYQKSDTCAE